jgi:hypothetical protein
MPEDRYEPNRVLGFPLARDSRAKTVEEPQRVMGFPVDWISGMDLDWLDSLAHPVRACRRWQRRRRLGPYAVDDDQPGPP